MSDMTPGRHERRGHHETGYIWCHAHNRPSPHSNTYCRIEYAKAPWLSENQCRMNQYLKTAT